MDPNADVLFSAEQIQVPSELPQMLKEFAKEILRKKLADKAAIADFAIECVK